MDFPSLDVEFDRAGRVHQPEVIEPRLARFPAPGITDLFVISHGWNNDIADATRLYEIFFAAVRRVLAAGHPPAFATGRRRLAVLKVFWPSKRFTSEELIPGGGLASVSGADEMLAIFDQLRRLADAPRRLGQPAGDPVRERILEQAADLVPRLDRDAAARRDFVLLLRSLLDPAHAHADDGTDDFFTASPEDLFRSLAEPVGTIPASGRAARDDGGLAVIGGGPAGLVGDFFDGFRGAAQRLLNFTTYYEMKARAGTVGRLGLAPVVRGVCQRRPDLRVHLVGHSFGGRLLTAAAHGLADDTTVASMSLLQAAYSHNGLAEKFDKKRDGFFRSALTRRRVTGPICITHTRNDTAVGVAYPLASRVARDPMAALAALGDADDPYGGMGRNGAQHTPEADGGALELGAVGQPLALGAGRVHNVNADACIGEHNDVCREPTAYLVLAAAAAA